MADVSGPTKGKRIRRMTPLERTRILPGRDIAPPGASYVLVDTSRRPESAPESPPDQSASNPRRGKFEFHVMALEVWLMERRVARVLCDLLPAFAECVAIIADLRTPVYQEIMNRFFAGELTADSDPEPNAITIALDEMERQGLTHPEPDLPTELIDIEMELYALTGITEWVMSDDDLIDLLNQVQKKLSEYGRVTGLPIVTLPAK